MATIKTNKYNKVEYWNKQKQEEWKKTNKATEREVKSNNRRVRRTPQQKLADEEFIWNLIKTETNITNTEIHTRLNQTRGYNPPLSLTTVNKALRDLRTYHTENMAAELQPYQEKKIITVQELLQIAKTELFNALDREDTIEEKVYGTDGVLVSRKVTKKKNHTFAIQWFKALQNTFKIEQELLGNLRPGETINTNIGIVDLGDKKYNLNIAHQDIASFSDEEFGYFIEQLNKGELDISELVKRIKANKNKMIIEGDVIND